MSLFRWARLLDNEMHFTWRQIQRVFRAEWAVETRYGPSSNRGSCPDGFVNSGQLARNKYRSFTFRLAKASSSAFGADPVIELWVVFLNAVAAHPGVAIAIGWRSLCEIFSPTESYLTGVEIVPSPLRTVKQLLQIAIRCQRSLPWPIHPRTSRALHRSSLLPRPRGPPIHPEVRAMPMKRQLQRGSIPVPVR